MYNARSISLVDISDTASVLGSFESEGSQSYALIA